MLQPRTARAVALGLVVLGALTSLANDYALRRSLNLAAFLLPRRYWEDVNGAIRLYLGKGGEPEPSPPPSVSYGVAHTHAWRATQRLVAARAAAAQIRPAEVWRTVPAQDVVQRQILFPVRSYEDKGRAWLLWIGFKLLGGVSPYLPLWIGAFFFAPVLAWSGVELVRWGRPGGGVALALLGGLSSFVAGLVTLPHSAQGFYLAAIVAVTGLAAYTVLGQVTLRGLIARAFVLGAFFTLCVRCRGTTVCALGGFVLALAVGAIRATPSRSRARAGGLFLLLTACFLTPYLLARETAPRNVWFGLWMGLGDFDRSKGYVWNDQVAEKAYEKAGHELGPSDFWRTGPESEPFYRSEILGDIRRDPLWFAGILARRTWATLLLPKLWPRAAADGVSMSPSRTVFEGKLDRYWEFAPTADWFGLGDARIEAPLTLLIGPFILLVLLALPLPRAPTARPWGKSAAQSLLLLCCPAVAALACPVLVSTATGPETQAFALTHFLAAGLLVDAGRAWVESRRARH